MAGSSFVRVGDGRVVTCEGASFVKESGHRGGGEEVDSGSGLSDVIDSERVGTLVASRVVLVMEVSCDGNRGVSGDESVDCCDGGIFGFLLDDPEIRSVWTGNLSFRDVLEFFNDFVFSITDSCPSFFENEALKRDFCERLKVFLRFVDDEIDDFNRMVKGIKRFSKLSSGYEKNIRKACYYAFFVHYGAKRGSEFDSLGAPKDYVYHVVRSGFNCLIRKMRFVDEKTLVACFLHDTREDYRKGIMGLLFADCTGVSCEDLGKSKGAKSSALKAGEKVVVSRAEQISRKFLQFEEGIDEDIGGDSSEASVSELVDIVTKISGDRAEALLEVFAKILEVEDSRKRFSMMKAIMVKIADRLDNVKSLKEGDRGGYSSNEQIVDETVYIFLAVARMLGMTNIVDWFYEYIAFVGSEEKRRKFTPLRRDVERVSSDGRILERGSRPRGRFVSQFSRMLSEELGRGVSEGIDFSIVFREGGYRYEDMEEARKCCVDGSYVQAHRSYIFFYPVVDDPAMANVARKVMRKIFSGKRFDRARIAETALGRLVVKNGGVGFHEAEYGIGAWAVFDSYRNSEKVLLGDFQVGTFYDDEEALVCRERVLRSFNGIRGEIYHLRRQYQLLRACGKGFRAGEGNIDCAVLDSGALNRDIRKMVLGDWVDVQGEGLPFGGWFFKSSDEIAEIRRVLDRLFMTVFMRRKRLVGVSVEGNKADVVMPEDACDKPFGPLVFSAPFLLGRRKCREKSRLSISRVLERVGVGGRGRKKMPVDIRRFVYGVGFPEDGLLFDRQYLREQVKFLGPLLGTYKQQLLSDDAVGKKKRKGRGKPAKVKR